MSVDTIWTESPLLEVIIVSTDIYELVDDKFNSLVNLQCSSRTDLMAGNSSGTTYYIYVVQRPNRRQCNSLWTNLKVYSSIAYVSFA